MREYLALTAGEAVTLVLERDVLDRAPEFTQPLTYLIRLLARDPWIVVALDHQQRAAHVFDVGYRRALDQLLPIGFQVAQPALGPSPPVRRGVLEHGHQRGSAANLARAPPGPRYPSHARKT